jgi:RHS repeat-associated protein
MDRTSQKYYYSHDELGSVTEITDNMGNVVEKYTYDAYGQATIRNSAGTILTASAITNPHMFTGRRLDPETNLFYFRNRMYSSVMGRFLQRDPIGYFDSLNLFQYTLNSPINWLDSYGLFSNPIGWIIKLGKNGGSKIIGKVSSEAQARRLRQQGKNILGKTKQKSGQIQKGASRGKKGNKNFMQHEGHDLRNGEKGMPHYQDDRVDGHTFWTSGSAILADLVDPFEASAANEGSEIGDYPDSDRDGTPDPWDTHDDRIGPCPS